MIWAVFALVVLGAVVFLAPAFFGAADDDPAADREVESYLAEIQALETDPSLAAGERDRAVLALQRQVLARQEAADTAPRAGLGLGVFAALAVGGGAVYALSGQGGAIGKPPPAPVVRQLPAGQPTADPELLALVDQLAERLATDRADDPVGWQLYARSLMGLGRFEDALEAYDQWAALSGMDPAVVAERDSARRAVAARTNPQRPGPSAQDMRDAQDLTEADRAAMIQGMVDGLSERLAAEPNDPQGWARLIRARLVLGQTEQARAEVARLRDALADRPDEVEAVLRAAGWTDGMDED